MGSTVLSEIAKKDLTHGNAPYVRSGNLYFDSLVLHDRRLDFVSNNKTVASLELPSLSGSVASIRIMLAEKGKLKIKIT